MSGEDLKLGLSLTPSHHKPVVSIMNKQEAAAAI